MGKCQSFVDQLRYQFQPLAIVDSGGIVLYHDRSEVTEFHLMTGQPFRFRMDDQTVDLVDLLEVQSRVRLHRYDVVGARNESETVFMILERARPGDIRSLLKTERDLYQLLFHYSANAVFAIDLQGHCVAANRASAQLSGYGISELLAMNFSDLVVSDDMPQVSAAFQRVIHGEHMTGRCRIRHLIGRDVLLHIDAFPVMVDGVCVGAFGIARDITILAKQEQALQLQREVLEQIARGVSLETGVQLLGDALRRVFPSAGVVFMKLDSRQSLSYEYGVGNLPTEDLARLQSIPIVEGQGLAATCVARRSFVAVADVRDDPLTQPHGSALYARGFRHAWAAPIASDVTAIHGALVVYGTESLGAALTEDILRTFGSLAGILIDRCEFDSRLYWEAHVDALTQLPNRRWIQTILDDWIHSTQAHHDTFAVYLVDIDRFRHANDAFGPVFGDHLLQHVASILTPLVGDDVIVGHLGADEFLILRRDRPGGEPAEFFGRRILSLFNDPITVDSQTVRVTASIGVVEFPRHGANTEALLSHAGVALHEAKKTAGDDLRIYGPTPFERSPHRINMEVDLQRGINHREFVPYFQPLYDAKTGRMVGAEALARWHHPHQGVVAPSEFIPLAEETGLIVPLTHLLMEQVARVIETLNRPHLPIALNISPLYVQRRHVLDDLRHVSKPERMGQWTLEIVESSFGTEETHVIRTLDACRSAGVTIALDDFGTGYSSLARLNQLPLDYVKIDQSFIRALDATAHGRAMVQAIIDLAHSLNLKTVAEGVETDKQRQLLTHLGCDRLQGFLLGRPMPPAQFLDLVRQDDPHVTRGGN